MVIPNFLIIGAAKAGTTSLYAWLEQHPQIYMSPVKETNFFALEGEKLNFPAGTIGKYYLSGCITNIEDYRKQFQGVTNETAIGEASPIYLYHLKAPERIQHYVPKVKLIAILRHPIERAYSNFLHNIGEGLEPLTDFAQALQEEESRIRNNWWWGFYYVSAGFYYVQLKRYFERFNPNQIKVYLYEDVKTNALNVTRDIFKFLQVDETFIPDMSTKYNVTGIPRNKFWHQFLSRPSFIKAPLKLLFPSKLRNRICINLKNRNLVKPQLPPAVRSQLIEMYREDILKLQDLIHRDLSKWVTDERKLV